MAGIAAVVTSTV